MKGMWVFIVLFIQHLRRLGIFQNKRLGKTKETGVTEEKSLNNADLRCHFSHQRDVCPHYSPDEADEQC